MSDTMEEIDTRGSLITGLPDDLALLCLARIPRVTHSSLGRVCKSWREVFRSVELFKLRASLMITDPCLVVVEEFRSNRNSGLQSVCDSDITFTKHLRHNKSLSCFMYDLKTKMRCDLPPLISDYTFSEQLNRGGFKCAALGSEFLVLGGLRLGLAGRRSVNIFDTITRKWSRGVDMQVARCFFSCGLINGKLYVAGGFNEKGEVNQTGEVYDPRTKQWSMIAPMPCGMPNPESDAVFKGRLYIKGRREGETRKLLCYDPVTDNWEHLKKMENGLMGGEFAPTDEHLFIFSRSLCVGKYDEKSTRWGRVGNITCYYFPFECPAKLNICFGKEVFFLNNMAGECMNLHKYDVVHQVVAKIFWRWQGAIVAV